MHPSLDAVSACEYGTQSDIGNFLHTWNIGNSCNIEITLITEPFVNSILTEHITDRIRNISGPGKVRTTEN